MERYELKENANEFHIFDYKTGMICLIIPKKAYKDPKSTAEGYKSILKVATRWNANEK